MSPPRVVILGGGTAGWMAACLMGRAWGYDRITLVESPDIGIIGVGEGSTPQLRAFFRTLGIDEAEWMPACNATYKVGIAFSGWSAVPGHARYFHPFASELDGFTEPQFHLNARLRRHGQDVPAHPDGYFLNTRLAAEGRAPVAPDHFPFDAAYGYHFDAYLVGAFLRGHAVARGTIHREARVAEVRLDADGAVAALVTDAGEAVTGDLFVDASGFRATIMQALGVPHRSYGDALFNDSAVVMPTPSDPAGTDPFTTATALSSGWAWRIPLTSRIGNGYVYSSRYIDADGAEAELRAHLGVAADDPPGRHLQMRVGRLERSWHANVLAVGLSQGFLEPLEATALHIVQATVEGFVTAFTDGGFTPRHRDAFNATIARRYDGIRDYIVLHYRLNRRQDTPYWRDAAAVTALSDPLKAMMTAWFTGADIVEAVDRLDIAQYYAPLSWGCMFAGYGAFPDRADPVPAPIVDVAAVADRLARAAGNYPRHDAVLARAPGPSQDAAR